MLVSTDVSFPSNLMFQINPHISFQSTKIKRPKVLHARVNPQMCFPVGNNNDDIVKKSGSPQYAQQSSCFLTAYDVASVTTDYRCSVPSVFNVADNSINRTVGVEK